jgi:hypothetical protein
MDATTTIRALFSRETTPATSFLGAATSLVNNAGMDVPDAVVSRAFALLSHVDLTMSLDGRAQGNRFEEARAWLDTH